jgi:glycosyltransferase involved in cell wall biosynthesis
MSELKLNEPKSPAHSSNLPLASIIITSYNYEKFLPQAIDSALKQSYPVKEIIVVDDGSTDNSRHIINSYGDQIIPVFKKNGGITSATNAGFFASQGELIFFWIRMISFSLTRWKRWSTIFFRLCRRPRKR